LLRNDNGGGKQMPINNISDWLSFLNERISSYGAELNSQFRFLGVVFALALAMVGISMSVAISGTVNEQNRIYLQVSWWCIGTLFVIGIIMFLYWLNERTSQSKPYQNALRIRTRILNEDLTNPDDIYQECINARILQN
jgi:type VI protein secretion system component VasF